MKFKAVKLTAGALVCAMAVGFVAGCGGGKVAYNNEEDAAVFSTQPLDGVFSPFFATSGTDMSVSGLTQIGMLANDENGNVAYGDNEAVVVKDYEIKTTGTGEDATTEYKFVLKNNIQFSNGSYLSMKDVLFNLYVYLDPVYTGASTIYSTDIVGLKAYRTQTPDSAGEDEQDSFMETFQIQARTRINALVDAKEQVDKNGTLDKNQFRTALQGLTGDAYAHVVDDYDKALELFREELNDDYSAALDSYSDTVFQDSKGEEHRNVLQSDVEMFLYNEGVLTWNKKDAQMTGGSVGPEYYRNWTKEQAIDLVFDQNIPGKIDEVVTNWMTAGNLFTYLTNKALEEYFQNNEVGITNISGIKFANKDAACTVNDKTYAVPEYEDDAHTHVKDGFNEVLSITIHKIDPKAIWNFAFSVAPMYYYSNQEQIAAFDYENHFGVDYASQTFFDDVLGSASKNSLPVGAGPYAVSFVRGGVGKVAGGDADVGAGDFYNGSTVYYERNPYYNADGKGPAKIKKVRYLVAQQNQMLNMLYSGDMDFVEPNAKTEIFNEVRGKEKEGIGNKDIQTSGYGYVGINAGKVPNLRVRQAIMHCVDVKLTAQYYGSHAEVLYRSMTKANWVYKEALSNKTSYYPFLGDPIPDDLSVVSPAYAHYVRDILHKTSGTLTEEEQKGFITALVEGIKGDPILSEQRYSLNDNGVYQNSSGTDTLKYTFTIVGAEQDHPAWDALWQAGEMLNKWGFEITVKTDPQGLIKLNTGSLAVWAAAWGSTIDPDMYQVYHKDSTATSVLNWGYRQILQNAGGKYNTEYDLVVNELSPLIEQAREINDQGERAKLYAQALDLVMELAVELPTYQRRDLFVYNANKFDESTFFQNASPFKGLTSDIHTISFNVER